MRGFFWKIIDIDKYILLAMFFENVKINCECMGANKIVFSHDESGMFYYLVNWAAGKGGAMQRGGYLYQNNGWNEINLHKLI